MPAQNQKVTVDFQIAFVPPFEKPRRLFLQDSGGWVRISIAVGGDADGLNTLGMDLSPQECRVLASELVGAALSMERQYPELRSLD